MSIETKKNWERDFDSYEILLEERKYFTTTELKNNFTLIYRKIYLYTTLTVPICNLDRRSKIQSFFFECKNNMIISFDLANLNYINASKQILRSCIESFFRLSLGLSRYIEYRENKKNGIYTATQTLKDLKSMHDSHKVGRLTRYVCEYYNDTPVKTVYEQLYNLYSLLSGAVHVNEFDNFTPHKYLLDYSIANKEHIDHHLQDFEFIINNIILILYYFTFYLNEEGVQIHKLELLEFEKTINNNDLLDQIENYFV